MERRRQPRVAVSWQVHLATTRGEGDGSVLNAALCGLLIATDMDLSVGQPIALRVDTDSGTEVSCVARVARKLVWDKGFGYGLETLHIAARDRRNLSYAIMLARRAAVGAAPVA